MAPRAHDCQVGSPTEEKDKAFKHQFVIIKDAHTNRLGRRNEG